MPRSDELCHDECLEETPESPIELPAQQMTTTDVESRCQDRKLRINARCKDSLQVTRKGSHKFRNANRMSPETRRDQNPWCYQSQSLLHVICPSKPSLQTTLFSQATSLHLQSPP